MISENKKKILVVDDEKNWLVTIKNILEPDYEVVLKDEPVEALNAVRKEHFSLVILDMKLPGMTGLELFSQMQKIAPHLCAIMLTGYPDVESTRSSFKSGLFDYLSKGNLDLHDDLRNAVKDAVGSGDSELGNLIAGGEGEELEFKSTARWDQRANQLNRELEKTIVKSVAGFLNSTSGGELLIGVDDGGNIVGLQADYDTLSKKNRDGYENYLNNLLLNAFGKDIGLFFHISFHEIEEKDICRIEARPSPKPVFVTEGKNEYFYIRVGNSTRLLSTREAINYVNTRWK